MDNTTLSKIHDNMLEIYLEIKRLCNKHGLVHFVVGGTLLGAVVHHGFIPWDDDLDIAMPRKDYDRFIHICQHELNPKYYLHHQSTDPNYWLCFAKVRKNNTIFLDKIRKNVKAHAGIYVDVFPFDYSRKAGSFHQSVKWRTMTYLNNYIYKKVTKEPLQGRSSGIVAFLFSFFTICQLSNFRDRIMKSFKSNNAHYYVDLAGGRKLDNSFFEVNRMLPLQEMPFGSITVTAPQDPNYYLLKLYGSKYTVIPPEDERVTHEPLRISFDVAAEENKPYGQEEP